MRWLARVAIAAGLVAIGCLAAALTNWLIRSRNERLGLEQALATTGTTIAFVTVLLGLALVINAKSRSERRRGTAALALGVLGLVPVVGLLIVFVIAIAGGLE